MTGHGDSVVDGPTSSVTFSALLAEMNGRTWLGVGLGLGLGCGLALGFAFG